MLIRTERWEAIRDQFSEGEKAELRKAVTGEAICPRGFVIDPALLTPELAQKITNAIRR